MGVPDSCDTEDTVANPKRAPPYRHLNHSLNTLNALIKPESRNPEPKTLNQEGGGSGAGQRDTLLPRASLTAGTPKLPRPAQATASFVL